MKATPSGTARASKVAATGGLQAGVLFGCVAGGVEAVLFLESGNLRTEPATSLFYLLLGTALYALALGATGSVLGLAFAVLPWSRAGAPGTRSFALVAAALAGVSVFVLGTWWVRLAPPDLAVFRAYVRAETSVVLLIAFVVSSVTAIVALGVMRVLPVERLLANRRLGYTTGVYLAVGFVLLVLVTYRGRAPSTDAGAVSLNGHNVVLITIDTLRANHLVWLGHDMPTSPLTDELARRGVVFSEAVAQYPLTTPSHASILTGRYVRSHGAIGNGVPIHESATLISEVLAKHGYDTAAVVTSPIIGSKYGFARGFRYFVERNRGDFSKTTLVDWLAQMRLVRLLWRVVELDRTTISVTRWIDRRARPPFFLWLHYITPHTPYSPPFSYERRWDVYESSFVPSIRNVTKFNEGEVSLDSDDLAHVVALYDAGIQFTEALLSRVVDALERRGLMDETLIVFTADHGESLYDRNGYIGHGAYLHDEEVLVPLLFYCPGRIPAGRAVPQPVETIDIAPTILDFLALPPDASFQGVSLMNLIDPRFESSAQTDSNVARPRHPSVEKPAFSFIHGVARMVRYQGWKYIAHEDGTEALYDLRRDPGETEDLVEREHARAEALRALLNEWDAAVPVARSEDFELDEESIRALRALGYVK